MRSECVLFSLNIAQWVGATSATAALQRRIEEIILMKFVHTHTGVEVSW